MCASEEESTFPIDSEDLFDYLINVYLLSAKYQFVGKYNYKRTNLCSRT